MKEGGERLKQRFVRNGGLLPSAAWRAAAFAVLWVVLTGADARGLWLGALTVLASTALSLALVSPRSYRLQARRVPGFFLYFTGQSLRGAVDVSRRALGPAMPIDPGLVHHRLRLRGEAARVFAAGALSLLPGTVAVRLEGDHLTVHALDLGTDTRATIERLEAEVTRLFGEET